MSLFNKAKSVDSIISQLTSTVSELETHAQDQLAKAGLQRAAARAAELAEKAHRAEHVR